MADHSVITHHADLNSQTALSSRSTSANGIVMATAVPRLSATEFELGGIRVQADRTLRNLRDYLEEAGSSMADVLHLTVYLTEIEDWALFNESYVEHFPKPYPARCALAVKELAITGMRVEVTAVAAVRPGHDGVVPG
jgi:enamine deaminase RidA (YjgF/YER057c/UK114 family)